MKNLLSIAFILSLSIFNMSAQENETKTEKTQTGESLKFKVKSAKFIPDSVAKPKIYVDGKLFEFDVDLIDQSKIESMSVIKGEKAINEYNSPNGVILIKTKMTADSSETIIRIREKTSDIKEKTDPLFIIDGNVVDKNKIKTLSPDDIESIEVLKDKKAVELYDAPNGVILIKTKKSE
jgi:hypothetical protein